MKNTTDSTSTRNMWAPSECFSNPANAALSDSILSLDPSGVLSGQRTAASETTPTEKGRKSERGEGVISTAISVLIVAFLGIALWTGFNSMMSTATSRTRTQVEQIGR